MRANFPIKSGLLGPVAPTGKVPSGYELRMLKTRAGFATVCRWEHWAIALPA
jgi:hypothetical protein